MPARRSAGRTDRLDGVECRTAALEARQLALDELGRGAVARRAHALGQLALEGIAIGREARQVGIAGVGLGHQVEQVEGAPGRREVGRDRRDDAAGGPGHDEHRVGARLVGGVMACGLFGQANRPAQIVGVANLDGAGVVQRLVDQEVGERRSLAARREVDGLDERLGPFARERLGEAGHRAAEHRGGAFGAVAVAPAEAGGRDEEGVGCGERTHRDGQELDAHAQRLAALGGLEPAQRALVVERGQPVDALDRAGGRPRGDAGLERLGIGRAVDLEDLDAELGQAAGQRLGDAAAVGHEDHAAALAELDAGGDALVERRAQDRDGNAAREARGVSGWCGGRLVGRGRSGLDRSRSGLGRRCFGLRGAVAHESHDVVQRRVVAQLQRIVALDPVRLTDRREHLRLLDRVDPQVRLEVEIHVQQIRRVARLLSHHRQHPRLDLIGRRRLSRSGCRSGFGRRRSGLDRGRSGLGDRGLGGAVAHEPDDVVQRRVVAQLQRVVALDPIGLTDRREHLRLLDRVDPQVRLEVEVHVQQVRRVARLLSHHRQHPRLDPVGRRRSGRSGRRSGRSGRRSGAATRAPEPALDRGRSRLDRGCLRAARTAGRGRARTRRRGSTSGSRAASTSRRARSRTSHGSTRTPPPA